MGWAIDDIIWHNIRDKILKDRYAGCKYSMLDSFSPVIIYHRKKLSGKDMRKISALFPKWIRVEFQEVDYEGQRVILYGRGDLIDPAITHHFKMYAQEIRYREEFKEYEKGEDSKWAGQ